MASTSPTRLQATLDDFDEANRQDPHQAHNEQGEQVPKELLYAQRMSRTLAEFAPDASEALQLAARSQHIRRWERPRESYPMDRPGYLRWRTDLKQFHGEVAAKIMRKHDYNEEIIAEVVALLNKRGLKTNSDTQALEDVICLVFLRHYFADFVQQHPNDKLVTIVTKTWRKMSEAGREAALRLSFSAKEQQIIEQALRPD